MQSRSILPTTYTVQLPPEKLARLKDNKQFLGAVFSRANRNARFNLEKAIFKWQQSLITRKIDASKVSLRLKGHILVKTAKSESHTSLQEAFLRWKVRADKSIVKKAVDQLVLYSRINEFNVFQRLKTLLPKESKKYQAKMEKRRKQNMSLLKLALFLQKQELIFKKQVIDELKPKQDQDEARRLLGWLTISISHRQRQKLLMAKFYQWLRNARLGGERLRNQMRKLQRLGEMYNLKNDQLESRRLREYFYFWRSLLNEDRLKKKFFGVLLKTTFGKLQKCYYKWKTLPDPKENAKKRSGLTLINKLTKKNYDALKLVWNQFADLHNSAKNKKTKVIRELIEVTFNQEHSAFYHWANYNTYCKLTETNLKKSKALKAALHLTQDLVKEQTQKMFIIGKKIKVCSLLERIVKRIHKRQEAEAFQELQSNVEVEKLKEKLENVNVKDLIERLADSSNATKSGRLRGILRKFYQNKQRAIILRRFIGKILQCNEGQALITFEKWKNLPDPEKMKAQEAGYEFERRLLAFLKAKKKFPFDRFQEIYEEGVTKKKTYVLSMIQNCQTLEHRKFYKWYEISQNQKKYQQCKIIMRVYNQLEFTLRDNIMPIMNFKQQMIKQRAILRIFNNFGFNLEVAYRKWKDYKNISKIQEQLKNEALQKSIQLMIATLGSKKVHTLSQVLRKFYQNSQVTQYKLKFFRKIFNTTSGGVIFSFMSWKSIPEEQDVNSLKKGAEFEKKLGNLIDNRRKLSFDHMKEIYFDGIQAKRYWIRLLVERQVKAPQRMFRIWLALAQQYRIAEAHKKVTGFYVELSGIQYSNLEPFIYLNDEKTRKHAILKRIILNYGNKLNEMFQLWRNLNQQKKISDQLDDEKKKMLIQLFSKFISGNNHNQLRGILKKFYIAFKRNDVIKQVLQKMLQTNFGQVYNGFQAWKGIPEPKNFDQQQRFLKFQASLRSNVYRFFRKESWIPLEDVHYKALSKKKLIANKLIYITLSGQKKAFIKWLRLVHDQRMFDKYSQLNYKLNDEILKQRLIGFFQTGSKFNNYALSEILRRFHRNSSQASKYKSYFLKMFNTTIGQLQLTFNAWKSIPESFDGKKASKFELQLNKFSTRIWKKYTWDYLADDYYYGNNQKRRSIQLLFQTQESRLGGALNQWRNNTKFLEGIRLCRLSINFYDILNNTQKGSLGLVFDSEEASVIKEQAIKKIILNSKNLLLQAFYRWLEFKNDQNSKNFMREQQQIQAVMNLRATQESCQDEKLKSLLNRFYLNTIKRKIIIRISNKFLSSITGQVFETFRLWKTIPELPDEDKSKKGSEFEQRLAKFTQRQIKQYAWIPLVDAFYEGTDKKRRAMLLLLKSTESDLQKRLRLWYNNVKLLDQVLRCKFSINFYGGLNICLKNALSLALENPEIQRIKKNSLKKIFALQGQNLKEAFDKWRNMNSVFNLQDALSAEKKKILLNNLQGYLMSSKSQQLRRIMLKFEKNARIKGIQDRFFAKLFETKAGGIINSFNKWKNLPIPKDNEAMKLGRKFERGLERFFQQILKASFDPMKELYFKSQNIKRQCLKKMFDNSMSGNKRLFLLWANQNRAAKHIEACKFTTGFYHSIQSVQEANIAPILQSSKEQQIKEKAIRLLLIGQLNTRDHAFYHWRNLSQQLQMQALFTEDKQKALLDALSQFQSSNKNGKLRNILRLFWKQANQQRLVREIQIKLLKTTSGQVFDTFQKWKSIPEPKDMLEAGKASKFQTSLMKFAALYWKRYTFNPFVDIQLDGLGKKRRAVVLLFKTQESELQSYLTKWNTNVKLFDEVEKCRVTINFYDQLRLSLKDNLSLALEDDEIQRIKRNSLDRLISNGQHNLREAFNLWRNLNSSLNLQDALSAEKKKMLIDNLQNYLMSSQTQQLRMILNKFNKNARIMGIQDRFFAKLFETKAGGIINSFNKWKNLPIPKDTEQMKLGRKFERGLERFFQQILKQSFEPMKEEYLRAQNLKRQCIRKLFENSMSGSKRLFLQWVQRNRTAKQIEACKLTTNFYNNLQSIAESNAAPVFMNHQEASTKEKAIRKLLIGFLASKDHAFYHWKNLSQQLKMQALFTEDKQKALLDALSQFQSQNKNEKLRNILRFFWKQSNKNKLLKEIQLKLLRTTTGQVFDTFQKWKTIPDTPDMTAAGKVSRFQSSLLKFAGLFWKRYTFNPFEDIHLDALGKKRRSVVLLFKTQESELSKYLNKWNTNVKLFDEVEKCRVSINFYDQLRLSLKDNLALVLEDDEIQRVKRNALERVIQTGQHNLREAFNLWRNLNSSMNLQDALSAEKKKMLLDNLQNYLMSSQTQQLRMILNKFNKNARIMGIQDRFFAKLFETKAGGIINSFNKWKNLPIPKDTEQMKLGRKFERGLEKFFQQILKQSFEPMKEDYLRAQNLKRQCIRKLFENSMSGNKRLFLQWVQQNRTAKQIEACKLTTGFYNSLQGIAESNAAPVFMNPQESSTKEKAIRKLLIGFLASKDHAFYHWRNISQQLKMQALFTDDKQKALIDALSQFQSANKNEKLRNILRLFWKQSNKNKLLKEIQLKLLRTTTGQVFDTFQKWKTIPDTPDMTAAGKVSRFQSSLLKFAGLYWKRYTFNPFVDINLDAFGKKRRSVVLLFKTQESELQKYLTKWSTNVKLFDEVEKCRVTINFYDQLRLSLKDNLSLALEDDEIQRIKRNSLDKLISNGQHNLREAFNLWRNLNSSLNLQDALSAEKKKMLIDNLQNYLMSSQTQQLRMILNKFNKNARIMGIQDRFFAKLFETKAGGIINSFNKWKNLPIPKDTEQMKLGRKFERGLERFFQQILKQSYEPMKEEYLRAQNLKRQCIRKLFENSMSGNKRLFLLWVQQNRTAKQIEACKLTSGFYNNLQSVAESIAAPVFMNPYEALIKEKAVRKLLIGFLTSKDHSFYHWKNQSQQLKMAVLFTKDRQRAVLDALTQYQSSNKNGKLRNILRLFRKKANQQRQLKEIQLKLLKTTTGQVFDTFQKWKSIPEPQDLLGAGKASKFQTSLMKFAALYWKRYTFNPFVDIQLDGLGKKRRAVFLLFKTQESELQRGLSKWNENVKLFDEVEKCRVTINFYDQLRSSLKDNLALALEDDEIQRIKRNSLDKLIQNGQHNLREAFNIWRNLNSSLNLQDALSAEKKKMLIDNLQNYLMSSQTQQLRMILNKFNKNARIMGIQDRFFAKLFETKAGGIINSFNKWKNLPIPKDTEQMKLGRKFERGLERFFQQILKQSYEPMKEEYLRAQNLKRQCIRKLFENSMSGNKRLFLLWVQQNRTAKQIEACKLTTGFYNSLQSVAESNAAPVFQNPQESSTKEKAIRKLLIGFLASKDHAFYHWRNLSQQLKMQALFTEDKQKALLDALSQFQSANKKEKLRNILRLFWKQSNKNKLLKEIQLRLLRTTTGQVFDTFQKWKTIPDTPDMIAAGKASRFQSSLLKFAGLYWKRYTFNPFVDINLDAFGKKRRSVVLLFKTQESELQKYLTKWATNVKLFDEVEKCRVTINFYDQLRLSLKDNLSLALEDDEIQRIKRNSLDKLIQNGQHNLREAFNLWRNLNSSLNLQDALSAEKKKMLIDNLQNYLMSSQTQQLRMILNKFNKNARIMGIQDRFFAKLFETKAGGIINSFNKWKNLPIPKDTEQMKLGRKFERGLERFFQQILKQSFEPMKEDYLRAQNIKRQCIRKLFENSMSGNKRLFLLWVQQNRTAKQIEACKQTAHFFNSLQAVAESNAAPAFQNPQEASTKEKAIRKLLIGFLASKDHAFYHWRNLAQQQKILSLLDSEKQKALIDALSQFQSSNKNEKLRNILRLFYKQANQGRLKKEITLRLLKTTSGQVFDTFQKWKNLPDTPDMIAAGKVSKFQSSLLKFAALYWKRYTFNPIEDIHLDALGKKRRAVVLLFKTQESELQQTLSKWDTNVKLFDEVEKCRVTINFYDQLRTNLKDNLALALEDDEIQRIKRNSLDKLIQNGQHNLREAFNLWRNLNSSLNLQDALSAEKKKMLIDNLQNYLMSSQTQQLRMILNKFNKNARIMGIQDRFFAKLFETKAGGIINSFNKWKNLPIPKDTEQMKLGRKFERGLERFFQQILKQSFEPMKEDYLRAQNIKRQCIRKLFENSMSGNKRLFLLWVQQNRTAKQIEACKQTTHFFNSLQAVAESNAAPVFQNPQEASTKEKAIRKLLIGFLASKDHAFYHWRNLAQQQKILSLLDSEKQKALIDALSQFQSSNKNEKLRNILRLFYKQANQGRLKKEITLRLLKTTSGQVFDTFQKWKTLPDTPDMIAAGKVSKFQSSLLKFAALYWKRYTFNPIEDIHLDALGKKRRAVVLLFKTQESELQQTLSKWDTNVKLFDEVEKCRVTINFYDQLRINLKDNLALALEDDEIQRIKRNSLDKLIQNGQHNLREAFNLWRNLNSSLNLQDALSAEKKKMLIDNLQNYLMSSQTQQLRMILNKFNKNARIMGIQDRFFAKLFETKAGGIINSFNKWKNLPIPKDTEQMKLGRKFERGLERFFQQILKQSYEPMKEEYLRAQNLKRQCIRKLFENSMSGNKRLFLLWVQQNRTAKQIEACKLTTGFYNSLQSIAESNVAPVFMNPQEASTKEKAIRKLLIGFLASKDHAFYHWRNLSQQLKMQALFTEDKQKALLDALSQFQSQNKNEKMRNILRLFWKQSNKNKLLKEIQLRLLRTTTGQVFDTFQKWKTIPDTPDMIAAGKASRFQSSLLKFAGLYWKRYTFNPFEDIHLDALGKKRRSVVLLFKTQESELQKYLTKWSTNVKLYDEVEKCRVTINFYDQLRLSLKDNLSLALEDNEIQRVKRNALDKVIQTGQHNLREAFNIWRNLNSSMNLQDALSAEKKKMLLDNLQNYLMSSQTQQLRMILNKFNKNARIMGIQDRFFAKLFETKAGGIINSFNKWKNLPIPKDTEQMKLGRKFERGLEKFFQQILKQSFEPMKEDYLRAQNLKRQCIRKLFENSMSGNKRLFLLWVQQNRTAKQIEACKLTTGFYNSLQSVAESNAAPVFMNPQESSTKEKAIRKLLIGFLASKDHAFYHWRNLSQQLKMQALFTEDKQKALIDALSQFQSANKNEKLRNILRLFWKQSNKNKLLQEIQLKLLRTTTGQVFDTFQKWKTIPDTPDMIAAGKVSKFQSSLLKFAGLYWKRYTFNPLVDINLDAFGKKRRSVVLLFKTQESELQKYLTKWATNVKLFDEVEKCRVTINFYDQLRLSLKDNLSLALEDDEIQRIKRNSLDKLISNGQHNLREAFNLWRNLNSSLNLQDALSAEKKKMLIDNLQNYLMSSQTQQLRMILNKFNKNARIMGIQDRFFAKLFETKAGGIINSFNKWKNLPIPKDTEQMKLGRKFERGLERFFQQILKQSFEPMKEDYLRAQNIKRQCIRKLFENSMSGNKRLFLLWVQQNRTAKQIEACKQTTHFFNSLQAVAESNAAPAFQNPQEASTKEKAIRKLLIGFLASKDHAFYHWRNLAQQQKILSLLDSEKQKALIDALSQFQSSNKNEKLRNILRLFYKQANQGRLKKEITLRLLKTTSGQVFDTFQKWKTLPDTPDMIAAGKVSKFQSSLLKFASLYWKRYTFNPFEDIHLDALGKKRRAVVLLFKTQESELQKTLTKWDTNVKLFDEVEKCRVTINFYDQLRINLKDNLALALEDDEIQRIKRNSLDQLIQNGQHNLREAFNLWRNLNSSLNLQDALSAEKKKMLIDNLQNYLMSSQTQQLRMILNKFNKNARIMGIQDRFFAKLFETKAGGIINSFNKWKNLPIPKDTEQMKLGRKFERGLEKFFQQILKQSFEPMKEDYLRAQNIKRQCIRKLFENSMSGNKRLFLIWVQQNRTAKQIEACKLTTDFYHNLQGVIEANASSVLKNPKEQALKEKAVKLLIAGQLSSLDHAFYHWRNFNQQEKIRKLLDDEKKKLVINALQIYEKNNRYHNLRLVLKKFYVESQKQRMIKDIQFRLLKTVAGQVFDTFQKWKSIPEDQSNQRRQASKFEQQLLKFVLHYERRQSWLPLEDVHYKAQGIKKGAAILLIRSQQSKLQVSFDSWQFANKKYQDQVQSKLVLDFYTKVEMRVAASVFPIVVDTIKEQSKVAQLRCLIDEADKMFKDSQQKWKDTKEKLDLLNEKTHSKNVLHQLNIMRNYLDNKNKGHLAILLNKFARNASQGIIKRRFFASIFQTTAGQLQETFNLWKSIPSDQTDRFKNAQGFELILLKLLNNNKKKAYQSFEDVHFEALTKKKKAVLLMLRNSGSGLKIAFNNWLFKSRSQQIGQDGKKLLAAQRFQLSKLSQINQAFREWRGANRLYNSSENEQDKRKRLMKQAFLHSGKFRLVQVREYFDRWRAQCKRKAVIGQCQAIQRMLHLNRLAERLMKQYVFQMWRQPRQQNPWFKRIAQMIAKNSRITSQISFWRMKDNAFTSGATMNTLQIIKCKKLFNNLRKAYDRNLTKAFMSIEHYGKAGTDNSFQPSQISFVNTSPNRDLGSSIQLQKHSQHLALNIMMRIIKNQLKRHFEEFLLNGSQSIMLSSSLLRSSIQPSSFKFIHKQLAVEKLSQVLNKNLQRTALKFFDSLSTQNLPSDSELLTRMNTLLQENSELRSKLQDERSRSDQSLTQDKDQIILSLNRRIDELLAGKLIKALEAYQDHLVEEAFIKIQEQ